jgi:hypothetical protein
MQVVGIVGGILGFLDFMLRARQRSAIKDGIGYAWLWLEDQKPSTYFAFIGDSSTRTISMIAGAIVVSIAAVAGLLAASKLLWPLIGWWTLIPALGLGLSIVGTVGFYALRLIDDLGSEFSFFGRLASSTWIFFGFLKALVIMEFKISLWVRILGLIKPLSAIVFFLGALSGTALVGAFLGVVALHFVLLVAWLTLIVVLTATVILLKALEWLAVRLFEADKGPLLAASAALAALGTTLKSINPHG